MKKLFSLVAMAAILGLASCGGRNSAENAETDSLKIDTVAVLDEPTAPAVVSTLAEVIKSGDASKVNDLVGQAAQELQKLIADGKAAAAAVYASKVQEFIEANKEKLQNLEVNTAAITDLVNKVKALPANAAESADAAATAVKADAEAAKQALKDAASQKAQEVKDAANQKAQEVKDAANQKVEETKAKANEKVEQAANKAAEAASKAAEKAGEAIDKAAAESKKQLGL